VILIGDLGVLGCGRSGREPTLNLASIAPVNIPRVEDKTIVPESAVYPPSVGSRGVTWMMACGGPE